MVYAGFDDVKTILPDTVAEFPKDISQHEEFARMYIDSKLAGTYGLPFDDVAVYPSGVPIQIKWVSALLQANRIWSELTVIEGLTDDTAGARWKEEADDLLDCLKAEDCKLTNIDGTIATQIGGSSGPRFFPNDPDIDPVEANQPMFRRDQAHEW